MPWRPTTRIFAISVALMLAGSAAAQEDLPVSLISYDGAKPSPLAADDPLRESVGMLFVPPENFAEADPVVDGYATAFLVSECYALTGTAIMGAMPASQRMFGGTTIEMIGMRFGLGLKPGRQAKKLTEDDFRISWPVTAHKVVPRDVDDATFGMSRWSLLHLDGCDTGDAKNGKPIAFDPLTSVELQAEGMPRPARHVAALMTDQLDLVEMADCRILGPIKQMSWDSTCSSWLGMYGGPVLSRGTGDAEWVAVGFVPVGNAALLLNPSGRVLSGKQTHGVYSVDAKNPRYFDYTTQIVPMAQVWPWIRDLVGEDNPGLPESRRAVAETETDLKKSLLMQMRAKPEAAWSAFDYTRFALGLEALGYEVDAAKLYKSAFLKDPAYLPAAARLSLKLDVLGPWAMEDEQLEQLRTAMGEAAAKYPEDPQMLLRRVYVDQKMALDAAVVEDSEKFLAAVPMHRGSSWYFSDLGDAHLGLNDLKRAEEAYRKALDLDALNPHASAGLARVKLFAGEAEEAVRLAEKAAKLDPEDVRPALVLAIARVQAGDLTGAITGIEEACAPCKRNAALPVYLAILRGYKRALDGEMPGGLLIANADVLGTYDELWPREVAEIFLGARPVESVAEFDYMAYTPDWRRSIRTGNIAMLAAYDLSQGRKIDIAQVEKELSADKGTLSVHLVPMLKDWAARVAASQP